MSRPADPPFLRGKTFDGTATPTATTPYDGNAIVGREWVFEDMDYSLGNNPKPIRSNRAVTVRAVRNQCTINSGGEPTTGNLAPKKAVHFLAGSYNTAVDGYATTLAAGPSVLVDEFLPSAGVQPLDLFYVVIEGPAMGITDLTTLAQTVNYNDNWVAQTAVTSGATTSGRLIPAVYTALTGGLLADQIRNSVGRALTAVTANNTNTNVLVDVTRIN